MSKFHRRLVADAIAMDVRGARIRHSGQRPHLTGEVDGIQIVLGLPLRPKDIPQNFWNCTRNLRRIVFTIRGTLSTSRKRPRQMSNTELKPWCMKLDLPRPLPGYENIQEIRCLTCCRSNVIKRLGRKCPANYWLCPHGCNKH